MCRFLLVKSANPINPRSTLEEFANMCQKSRAPDGDKQEDGWGLSWIKTPREWRSQTLPRWQNYKSLKPIWNDRSFFSKVPNTNLFMAHARSASFDSQKGIPEYNQPYVDNNLAFVFNGMIRGVKLNRPVPGRIGAQKIFYLIQQDVKAGKSLRGSLESIHQLLRKSSKHLRGLNLGISDGQDIAALCAYQDDKGYFTLNYHQGDDLSLICSQPIGDYRWSKMKQGQVINL